MAFLAEGKEAGEKWMARKNALTSPTNATGSSMAAKCHPDANSVQWDTLYEYSKQGIQ